MAIPHWRPAAAWRPAMNPAWWQWLASRDSLTRRLGAAMPQRFAVRLLAQRLTRPRRDEARALGVPASHYVWCREVALCSGDTPWVLARSVAPLASLTGQRLGQLGERSLGHWLFRQPDLERGPIAITRGAPPFPAADALWGRRSRFRHGRFEVLVQEFFLTAMADELGLATR
ncbi:chorismate--pyruvate lyase family protein [Modicisalibacter tunisiensis]|uniref:chorismate--pyruvate lyase family protein n=1 Tax=Modicisalibacter tunisiensis TaxID=390637 RepID=UPI001CCC8227|nr:chorismate lyase [Modicisalibacter tunisiensis]